MSQSVKMRLFILFLPKHFLTNFLFMKKTLIVFGIFISCVSICFSQDSDYKLGSYVNPHFKRKALDFGLNSAGGFNKTTVSKYNSLAGNMELKYDLVSNSEKEQAHTYGYLSGAAGSTSRESDNERNASSQFSLTRQAFHFFKPKTFFELSPSVAANYQYAKTEEKDYFYGISNNTVLMGPYYNKNNVFSSNLSLKLGIGKGRIEDVRDARQAIYIIQELQKKNILKRSLTNDEVNALTEQITLVKNQRYLDYRIQLADEISKVDSFLVANDFVEKANTALYFTSLYDKWLYGDRDLREAGSYIKGGVAPQYYFTENRGRTSYMTDTYIDMYRTKSIESYYGAAVYVDYRYEKPMSLAWQSSFRASASSGLYKYRSFDDDFYKTNVNVSYKLGYYPNTRTYISGTVSQDFNWNRESYHIDDDYYTLAERQRHTSVSQTRLSASAYYYLSPQLRLFGQCDLSLSRYDAGGYSEPIKDKYPATSFQFGLTYAIF